MLYTVRYILVGLSIVLVAHCKIPDYIKLCPRTHHNISACILNSIESLRPLMAKGIEELDVPGLEELKVDGLVIDKIGGASQIATNISDIHLYGATNFIVDMLEADIRQFPHTFLFVGILPQLRLKANYQLDSKILFLNLKGEGLFHANVTNYTFKCLMKGDKEKVNDVDYLLFEKMKCNATISKASVLLENLFDGNVELSKLINDVINDNIQILFEEIRPGLLLSLEKLFTEISNKITLAFPYEGLFPEK